MRHTALFIGIATAMLASCTVQEEFRTPVREDVKFYATFEQPDEAGTKVYANRELYLRWDADDQVSIFNKNTYNQQYRFLGETGANAGEFAKVDGAEFVTGNAIDHVVSFYPYAQETLINENELIEFDFPAEQFYRSASFGLKANPMISVSDDNFLQFKNIGGYLTFSLYGEGSVNSIVLKGNLNETVSGRACVSMTPGSEPVVCIYYDSSAPPAEIVLTCTAPVALPSSEESAKEFWLVVPPITFYEGFTVTFNTSVGTFTKKTTKSIAIERNRVSRMAPMRIHVSTSPDIVFEDPAVEAICLDQWDSNFDGRLSYDEAAAVTDLGTAFKQNKSIVRFNELQYFTGLTAIADEAFRQCENLTSVTLPESVTVIGQSAFMNCSALSGIHIPEGVTVIDRSAFSNCTSLGNMTFPASLTTIGISAFLRCHFTSLEIPAGVTEIGKQAFDRIPGLQSIVVDSTNPVYDSRGGCNAIIETAANDLIRGCATTVIPDSVTSLREYAFCGVAGATSFDIPASVTSLGSYAFGECPDLTSAYIPASVTSIGLGLFRVCSKLTSIIVDPANQSFDSREGCNAIIETETNKLIAPCPTTVIPGTVTAIGQEAYSDCDYLVGDLVIPEGIESVGQVAFTGCGIVSLTLPTTLQEIGIYAFSFIPSLVSATCLAVTPPEIVMGQYLQPFTSVGEGFKLYVPAESLEAYQTAVGWKTYADIMIGI